MMLRPEITQADNNYQGGLNMQMAENSGEITVNGKNSVGVTVVKSASTVSHLANNGFLKTSTHVIIPVGQLLASRSDEANKRGILNTGTINVLMIPNCSCSLSDTSGFMSFLSLFQSFCKGKIPFVPA